MSTDNLKLNRYTTISSIVYDVLNDMGTYTKENFKRYSQFAIRGVTKMYLFNISSFDIAHLTATANGVVELPADFIDYYKIGIRKNGQIYTLTQNDRLLIPRGEECGVVSAEETYEDEQATYFIPHIYNGEYSGALYGAGGGVNDSGYFRIDKERNQLILSGVTVGTTIILEYQTTGVSKHSNTLIPIQAKEAIIAFVHWMRKKEDGIYSANETMLAKQYYDEEVAALRHYENMFTADEYQDMKNENIQGTFIR